MTYDVVLPVVGIVVLVILFGVVRTIRRQRSIETGRPLVLRRDAGSQRAERSGALPMVVDEDDPDDDLEDDDEDLGPPALPEFNDLDLDDESDADDDDVGPVWKHPT